MKAERPQTLTGFTRKIKTGLGNVYITVNELNNIPFEVFVSTGKCGQSIMAKAEVVGRLVSLALRANVPINEIIAQLEGIAGEYPIPYKNSIILSIPDAVGKVLKEKYGENKNERTLQSKEENKIQKTHEK